MIYFDEINEGIQKLNEQGQKIACTDYASIETIYSEIKMFISKAKDLKTLIEKKADGVFELSRDKNDDIIELEELYNVVLFWEEKATAALQTMSFWYRRNRDNVISDIGYDIFHFFFGNEIYYVPLKEVIDG